MPEKMVLILCVFVLTLYLPAANATLEHSANDEISREKVYVEDDLRIFSGNLEFEEAGETITLAPTAGTLVISSTLAADTNVLDIAGNFTYTGAAATAGHVLVSDASGNATWAVQPTGPAGPEGAQGVQGVQGNQGPQGSVGDAATGLVTNCAVSENDVSTSSGAGTVSCSGGRTRLSGGVFCAVTGGDLHVERSEPNGTSGWRGECIRNSGSGNIIGTVYVVCCDSV